MGYLTWVRGTSSSWEPQYSGHCFFSSFARGERPFAGLAVALRVGLVARTAAGVTRTHCLGLREKKPTGIATVLQRVPRVDGAISRSSSSWRRRRPRAGAGSPSRSHSATTRSAGVSGLTLLSSVGATTCVCWDSGIKDRQATDSEGKFLGYKTPVPDFLSTVPITLQSEKVGSLD